MQSALFGPSYVDLSIFLTMGFIVSSFGLPIVLERAGIVSGFPLFAAKILLEMTIAIQLTFVLLNLYRSN